MNHTEDHHDHSQCGHDHDHDHDHHPNMPFYRPEGKIGRNDPCFCGSQKKYKKCCFHLENTK